jgi:superkiller protein 3
LFSLSTSDQRRPANSEMRRPVQARHCAEGEGQVEQAIASYRKAIALDPKLASAHYNLGNALAGKGKVEEAIECYRKAIALDPKNASAHNNLGLAL